MWQSHPSAIRKSSQKSDDLDWNPIANTIGNIESIIGQGNPVATRGTKYSSRRFWLIARETPASVLATCQNPEAWKITQLRFIGNTLISANFVRFCQSAPLTRSTMKISSNERVIKEPFVPDWTIEWSSITNLRDFLYVSWQEFVRFLHLSIDNFHLGSSGWKEEGDERARINAIHGRSFGTSPVID